MTRTTGGQLGLRLWVSQRFAGNAGGSAQEKSLYRRVYNASGVSNNSGKRLARRDGVCIKMQNGRCCRLPPSWPRCAWTSVDYSSLPALHKCPLRSSRIRSSEGHVEMDGARFTTSRRLDPFRHSYTCLCCTRFLMEIERAFWMFLHVPCLWLC